MKLITSNCENCWPIPCLFRKSQKHSICWESIHFEYFHP